MQMMNQIHIHQSKFSLKNQIDWLPKRLIFSDASQIYGNQSCVNAPQLTNMTMWAWRVSVLVVIVISVPTFSLRNAHSFFPSGVVGNGTFCKRGSQIQTIEDTPSNVSSQINVLIPIPYLISMPYLKTSLGTQDWTLANFINRNKMKRCKITR